MHDFVKNNSKGFTLLEVLVSITILSVVLITLLAFFTQSYTYTNLNKDKTVALNIGRSVVTYIEKQDFQYMKTYLEEQTTNGNSAIDETGEYILINGSSCDETITITKNEKSYNLSLFQEQSSCELVLTPQINGQVYNTDDHFVIVKLRPTPAHLTGGTDPLSQYIVHFDVEVHWGSTTPIMMEGVISNDTN
ncbi:type IV pilus modification PilV family protein [Bacillus sp. AK128]